MQEDSLALQPTQLLWELQGRRGSAWKTQCREQGKTNANCVNQLDSSALPTQMLFHSISDFPSQKSPPNTAHSSTVFFFPLYKYTYFWKTAVQSWQSLITLSAFRLYLRKLLFYQTSRKKKKKKRTTKSIFSANTAAKPFRLQLVGKWINWKRLVQKNYPKNPKMQPKKGAAGKQCSVRSLLLFAAERGTARIVFLTKESHFKYMPRNLISNIH